ncbi:MAG: M56 family metallopeptidase [Taibaiella sp.]|nr:M56 family metallopeptidase [Taibaiella sp.]
MLQYIINSTAIWLSGFIVYDLFFRREAYHSYNRFYLICIILSGAILPLWQWDYDSVIYTSDFSQPIIEQTVIARGTIVNKTTANFVLGWEQWLQIIYMAGVAISGLILFRDLLIILKMYRRGNKSKDGTWTIIETGAMMSPFSAFRMVFISSKGDYTREELAMVLAHEEQHGHLLHFIDVLLLRLFQILFWYNPMIYLLEKRLLLVHEYQADKAVENNPSVYGRFLVEQSVLNAAPVLAHSFIRSPLKKRILMLTRKTTTLARGKQILIAPFLVIALLLFTQHVISGELPDGKGDKYSYKGNIITYSKEGTTDTIEVRESVTKEPGIVLTRRPPRPILINREKVYTEEEIKSLNTDNQSAWVPGVTYATLREYLLTNLDKEIRKLHDGEYVINVNDIIVDKKGKIAFFRFGGIREMVMGEDGRKSGQPVDSNLNEKFAKKVAILLNNAPSHRAAWVGRDNVYCLITSIGEYYEPFIVKDGKLISL